MAALISLATLLAATLAPADLEAVGGGPFSLQTMLARGPAVVVFWNSWLPGSAQFLDLLHEVEATATTRGWQGAIIVFQDERAEAAHTLGVGHLTRVLDRRGALVRQFQVTRAPAVLLVDSAGKVMARAGPDPQEVRALLLQVTQR